MERAKVALLALAVVFLAIIAYGSMTTRTVYVDGTVSLDPQSGVTIDGPVTLDPGTTVGIDGTVPVTLGNATVPVTLSSDPLPVTLGNDALPVCIATRLGVFGRYTCP